ncbi:MAG: VOC family protein [Solirubrobacteraceae bacterium]|nr:VOC family protein [Solirubrobacteraceae bacterium]
MRTGLVPNLWFDDNAEEAADFYVSIFPDSQINLLGYYTEAGPGKAGTVVTVDFTVNGTRLIGINGGPAFPPSEYASLLVECDDQDEIDRYWAALIADGGRASQCGWCKDRFGVSWQVVPAGFDEMFGPGADPERAARAMKAVLGMTKMDIAEIERAADGITA